MEVFSCDNFPPSYYLCTFWNFYYPAIEPIRLSLFFSPIYVFKFRFTFGEICSILYFKSFIISLLWSYFLIFEFFLFLWLLHFNSTVFLFHRCDIVFLLSKDISCSFFVDFFCSLSCIWFSSSFLILVLSAPFISCLVTLGYPFMFGSTKTRIGSGLLIYRLHCRVIEGASGFIGGCGNVNICRSSLFVWSLKRTFLDSCLVSYILGSG